MNRRDLIKSGAALAVAAPSVITARSQETLIVNTQGGEYQELVERVVIRPFEKKFGVKVIHDATGTASQDYAKIRAARGAISAIGWRVRRSTSTGLLGRQLIHFSPHWRSDSSTGSRSRPFSVSR